VFCVAEATRRALLSRYDQPIREIDFLEGNTLLFKMHGRRRVAETREIIRDWFEEHGYGEHDVIMPGMGLVSLIANGERSVQKVIVDEELYVMLKFEHG